MTDKGCEHGRKNNGRRGALRTLSILVRSTTSSEINIGSGIGHGSYPTTTCVHRAKVMHARKAISRPRENGGRRALWSCLERYGFDVHGAWGYEQII